MKGLAAALIALGVADLVWINAELGPRAFPADPVGADAPALEASEQVGPAPEAVPAPHAVPAPPAVPSPAAVPLPQAVPAPVPEAAPEPAPEVPGMAVVVFATSEVRLADPSALASVVELLAADPRLRVQLTGHADERGSERTNYRLGLRRANAVKQSLVEGGVSTGRITVRSQGETNPLALGEGTAAHRTNRRVEVVFSTQEPR